MNKDMLLHHHHQQHNHNHNNNNIQQQQEENMSNLTSTASGDQASVSSGNRTEASGSNYFPLNNNQQQQEQEHFFVQESSQPQKKRRNQPGNPDPESEVIALSPKTLMATNRFVCEICNKGFQRDQNLQLHRRGHNLPWKLKQRSNKEVIRKKVYVCPEPSCVHHEASRALGDLTGIKKHFCRKHGEKKWKCDKCSKKYAVLSDCKAHSKTCGTKEYRCDCGTLFSRRDSFITHRAFCEALAEETAREVITPNHQNQHHDHDQTQQNINVSSSSTSQNIINNINFQSTNNNDGSTSHHHHHSFTMKQEQQTNDHHHQQHHHDHDHIINYNTIPPWLAPPPPQLPSQSSHCFPNDLTSSNPNPNDHLRTSTLFSHHHQNHHPPAPAIAATALLQKAAQMGPTKSNPLPPSSHQHNLTTTMAAMMTSSSSTPRFSNSNNNLGLFQEYAFDQNGSGESSFDDSFGGLLRRTNATASNAGDNNKKNGGSGGGEGLTRDFLGLRPLMSHNEILSFAELGNCINTSAPHHSQKPWQG